MYTVKIPLRRQISKEVLTSIFKILIVLSTFLVLSNLTALSNDSNIFYSPAFGFKITKLDSWNYVSEDSVLSNLKQIKTRNNRDLSNVSPPLLSISKSTKFLKINPPYLEVRVKPIRYLIGKKPKDIMSKLIPMYKKTFFDFELLEGPVEKKVAGFEASYMSYNSTAYYNNEKFPLTLTDQWLIFTNDFYFIITGSANMRTNENAREEIHQIVKTINIEH